ncbi:MAG: diguanylate cyclase [Dehalococcoidales bacterium]|nr:diguanylate cyclase [Dehalococcoidales bacterium]
MKNKSDHELQLRFDSPVVTWLQKESHPLTLRQIDTVPQFKGLWESEKESLRNSNLELFCPLKSHNKLVGILGLSKKRSGRLYTQEDIELVMSVASQSGIVVENARLYDQAMTWAITDGLTKLYNHRYLHERLDEEIARGTRFGAAFSLIMIDIDFFKTYNDTYGHLAGDEVLASVSRCIQNSIRTIDMPFRYGGEEFAVILPETMLEGAYVVAERIREKIEQKIHSGRTSVTASLGIASWPTDGVTKEQILASADKALYAAKETGRNRTCAPSDVKKQGLVTVGAESETQRIAISMIFALAATVDAKDHYTYGHSRKVSQYAVAMAEAMNLPKEKISVIRNAGLLHDIGKIGIPDSILNKEGMLDEQEWRQIKAHPELGVEILRYVAELSNSLPIILNHHEHYDGNGYPSGLSGEQIPLEARLLSVADAYDAMTSLRPYHNQRSPQDAINELKRCAGTNFDPELVEIFCKIVQPLVLKGEGEK